eukprot:5364236-Prymnesium_polylepis.1
MSLEAKASRHRDTVSAVSRCICTVSGTVFPVRRRVRRGHCIAAYLLYLYTTAVPRLHQIHCIAGALSTTQALRVVGDGGARLPGVRAWGDCTSEFSRYFESVVGDRPEFCVLDFHGFEDLDYAVIRNIVSTSWLPVGHKDRFDNGNTAELASAVVRTWETHPTSERIVEDMTRLSA